MNTFLEELAGGVPDWTQFERVIIRLLAAMLLGAIIGVQREKNGQAGGFAHAYAHRDGQHAFRPRGGGGRNVDE